jgi:hypothetical protein
MKIKRSCASRGVSAAAAAVALAATLALDASALDLQFSQTTGFYGGDGVGKATQGQLLGGPSIAGRGGLEFSTAVTGAPGAPFGGLPAAPANIWQGVAWGCLPGGALNPANCANNGVVGNALGSPDASGNPARSSFKLQGQFGLIQEGLWTDVSVLTHFNKVIDNRSNILRTVEIRSQLRLGPDPTPVLLNLPVQAVFFTETNNADCTVVPAVGAPVNPLGSTCDDFAIVSGLDLTSIFLPAGSVGNAVDYTVDFRLFAAPDSGALVCDGSTEQPAACAGYAGPDVVIYTAEDSTNTLKVQARLRPAAPQPLPLFVIGDVEPHAVGNVVNFWGAQWWKNNLMSGPVSKGVASFKGYASNAQDFCGGRWESRPGNSSKPPATIPDEVAIIVTDTVVKNGPNISGTIKEIVIVTHDGKYGPAPGHRGSGPVTRILCTTP